MNQKPKHITPAARILKTCAWAHAWAHACARAACKSGSVPRRRDGALPGTGASARVCGLIAHTGRLRRPRAGDNIRSLWTVRYEDFTLRALVLFAVAYFFSAAWTGGLALPSGSFSSTLLLGSCLGRIMAHLVRITGLIDEPDAPLFSLLGAAGLFTGATPPPLPSHACTAVSSTLHAALISPNTLPLRWTVCCAAPR